MMNNQSKNGDQNPKSHKKPGLFRKPSRKQENINNSNEGILSKLGDIQFWFTHFLPSFIASLAGLSLAIVLFIYRDIIAKDIFPQLTSAQATAILFTIIGLTFFLAIIGLYAWLATKREIQFEYVIVFMILIFTILAFLFAVGIGLYAWLATKEGIQFNNVLVFVFSTLTILSFMFAAIYMVTRNKQVSSNETTKEENKPEPPNPWYLKAIAALEHGNHAIALEYVNKGLNKTPKNVSKPVASLLALKIKLLLLIGGHENRITAKNIADQNYGYLPALDRWIDCLKQQKFFSIIITTHTELETQCPSPSYYDKQ